MQATGVYHLPLVDVLDQHQIHVIIVDPRQTTHAPGRPKTDVLECQWIQRLHTYGFLRASFVPEPQIRKLRTYQRHRDMLLRYAAGHVQHMQKALELLNCKLTETIKDIVGVTGIAIGISPLGCFGGVITGGGALRHFSFALTTPLTAFAISVIV